MAVEARSAPCSIAAGGCGQASPSDRSSSSMSKRVGNMSGVRVHLCVDLSSTRCSRQANSPNDRG